MLNKAIQDKEARHIHSLQAKQDKGQQRLEAHTYKNINGNQPAPRLVLIPHASVWRLPSAHSISTGIQRRETLQPYQGTLQAFQQKSQQPRARYRTQGIQAHELRGTTHHGHDPAGASCATRDHITDSRAQGPLHHFSLPRQFCRQHHRRGCPGPVRSRPCHFRPCHFYYVQHIPQTYYTDSHTYTSQQLAGLPVFSHKTSILPQVQQTPIFKSSDY